MADLSIVTSVLADIVEPGGSGGSGVPGPVYSGGSMIVPGIIAVLAVAVAAFIIVKIVKGHKK